MSIGWKTLSWSMELWCMCKATRTAQAQGSHLCWSLHIEDSLEWGREPLVQSYVGNVVRCLETKRSLPYHSIRDQHSLQLPYWFLSFTPHFHSSFFATLPQVRHQLPYIYFLTFSSSQLFLLSTHPPPPFFFLIFYSLWEFLTGMNKFFNPGWLHQLIKVFFPTCLTNMYPIILFSAQTSIFIIL